MDFVDASQTTQNEQKQYTEKDQVVSTHDVTDRKQETEGTVVVEEVSLVEEEVKISAVVDSADTVSDAAAAVSEAVEETSSLAVETTSELQPLEKVSLEELSGLIDFDASKGVADETNEEKAVPPITPVNTNTAAVDVGETKDAVVDADAESATAEPTKISVSSDTDKVLEKEAKEKESIAKDKKKQEKDKLKDDPMQLEQDASVKKDDADAATEAPDRADASPKTEEMDIDESVKPSADKKKKTQSAKEPARKGNQDKGKKSTKVQESENELDIYEDEMMEEEYEVEKIAGHRVFKGKVVKYIVKWKGYPSSENTTENATTMHDDVPELCAAYWATCKEKRPDNVPQVATEELKPLLEEQQQQKNKGKAKLDAAHISNDSDDDDSYQPKPKARSPSPVAAVSPPPPSSKDKAESAPSEEEPRARSRRPTPAPSSLATSTSSDATTPKQLAQTPANNNNNNNNNKRKRAVSTGAPEPSHVKKFKKNMEHIPDYMLKLGYQFPTHWPNKKTEWDVDVKMVCVQASPIDSKVRFTYLEWNNGEKTIHTMKEAHEMIPDKLINYYEERLQFV